MISLVDRTLNLIFLEKILVCLSVLHSAQIVSNLAISADSSQSKLNKSLKLWKLKPSSWIVFSVSFTFVILICLADRATKLYFFEVKCLKSIKLSFACLPRSELELSWISLISHFVQLNCFWKISWKITIFVRLFTKQSVGIVLNLAKFCCLISQIRQALNYTENLY